jgi:hypothetical protein
MIRESLNQEKPIPLSLLERTNGNFLKESECSLCSEIWEIILIQKLSQ